MDKDIQEMFQKKNREILIQNLQLDIDRNIEIMKDALTNLFDLQFDIGVKNIYSMYNEKVSLKEITKILMSLQESSFQLLIESLENKKNLLLNALEKLEFEEKQMDAYYQLIFQTTEEVLEIFNSDSLEKDKKKVIAQFSKKGQKYFEENDLDIIGYRIRDYIVDRLFGKLEDKVKEELFIRDNNLSNKGKESYEKFQELEKRTTQA